MRRLPLLLAAALAAGCAGGPPPTGAAVPAGTDDTAAVEVATPAVERPAAVVHKSATCTCCGGHVEHLEANGFAVTTEIHDDLTPVKDGFGIPFDEQSCHTTVIDGYVVEGHVPIEAIDDLLAQQPDIDGITLAGMPSGSPGMPGEQVEAFVVRTLEDGTSTGVFGRY